MHIADGVMPAAWCAAAHAVTLTGLYACGRRIDAAEVSRMGLLSAAAFTISLVHFPLAGTSIHLGLYGLLGVLLRQRAFPVIFATLLFQALLFQHGGLLSLGLNSLNLGLGAMAGWAAWRTPGLGEQARAFAAGFAGMFVPALLLATEFAASGYGRGFFFIAGVYAIAAAAEGAVTAAAIGFFRRMKPEALVPA